MCDRCEHLEEALERIVRWASAYPGSVFPPMTSADLQRAHVALKERGMNIDRISAHAMRHALEGVGMIAVAALDQAREGEGLDRAGRAS